MHFIVHSPPIARKKGRMDRNAELVGRLDELLKHNEVLKKQNQMFASYVKRNPVPHEEKLEKRSKRKQRNMAKFVPLTPGELKR